MTATMIEAWKSRGSPTRPTITPTAVRAPTKGARLAPVGALVIGTASTSRYEAWASGSASRKAMSTKATKPATKALDTSTT